MKKAIFLFCASMGINMPCDMNRLLEIEKHDAKDNSERSKVPGNTHRHFSSVHATVSLTNTAEFGKDTIPTYFKLRGKPESLMKHQLMYLAGFQPMKTLGKVMVHGITNHPDTHGPTHFINGRANGGMRAFSPSVPQTIGPLAPHLQHNQVSF